MAKLSQFKKLVMVVAIMTIAPVKSIYSQDMAPVQARSYSDRATELLAVVGVVYLACSAYSLFGSWVSRVKRESNSSVCNVVVGNTTHEINDLRIVGIENGFRCKYSGVTIISENGEPVSFIKDGETFNVKIAGPNESSSMSRSLFGLNGGGHSACQSQVSGR